MNKIVINNPKFLKKAKIKLMSFFICSSLLVGCGSSSKNIDYKYQNEPSTSTTNDDVSNNNVSTINNTYQYFEDTNTVSMDLKKEINENKVSLSIDEQEQIKRNIDAIKVDYLYSDLFKIDDALEEYNKVKIDENNINLIKDNKVDYDEFYDIVCSNNTKYLSSNNANSNYSPLPSSSLQNIAHIIVDNVNDKLNSNYSIDISLLDNTLSNLKILSYMGFGAAAVDDKNVILGVDLNTINKTQQLHPEVDALSQIIRHETNHCIQVISGDNLKNKNYDINYGICYHFPNLEVNSLYYHFLFEGSAERLAIDNYKDNKDSLFYSNNIMSIESIDLAILLNEKSNSTILESNMFQHDLDSFLNLFHVKNNEDKKEIISMLYAYELINTESDEFMQAYANSKGYKMNVSEKEEYKIILKGSIATTLTKQFYYSLIERLNNNEMSIKEIFELISIFEDEISRITWYESRQDYYQDFLEKYKKIQTSMFEVIADKEGYLVNDILSSYYDFHNTIDKYENISSLDIEKNTFLKEMFDSRKSQRKSSIASLVSTYQKQ